MTTQSTNMAATKILIVEDEVLIADTIRMSLERNGYRVTDTVISFEEAVASVKNNLPDVVLLDIRLNGPRTGVDVANFLRKLPSPPAFIYLTSQMDDYYLELAKQTHPAGYLGKPIHVNTLLATLKVTIFNAKAFKRPGTTIELRDKGVTHVVRIADICYLQADHVYVKVVLTENRIVHQRSSMQEVLNMVSNDRFVQVHRGFAVNLDRVTGHDATSLYFGEEEVPVSRRRRPEIQSLIS